MASSVCAQCGHPLAPRARFCGQCGTLTAPASEPPPPQSVRLSSPPPALDFSKTIVDAPPRAVDPDPADLRAQRTMMGYDASLLASGAAKAPSPAPSPPVAPAVASMPEPKPPGPRPLPSMKGTMMGISADEAMGKGKGTMLGIAPADPPVAQLDPRKGTMLGVAIPGIAPAAASSPRPQPVVGAGTMIGVAAPGIAPTSTPHADAAHGSPRKPVEILPKPAPLVDDEPEIGPLPERKKRGVPLGLVAGIAGVLVAAAGGAAFFIFRSVPLVVQPGLDKEGHEQLHIHCETCQNGTTAELGSAHATFTNKEADLPLETPLTVGNNPLTIRIHRPTFGRDDTVHVIAPVAFRIRADLSELAAARPAVLVRVEALNGTDVRVDNKPVALDAGGHGTYAADLSAETEGPTEELRLVDRIIPYVVTPKGAASEKGKLTVRLGIAPLRLDAPGTHAVVDGTSFRIAGRTVRGGSVTANGTPVHTDPDGTFAQAFDIPKLGDLPVEVKAAAPQLASRSARLVVTRVEHLADEAKTREEAPEMTYDAIAADIAAAVGKSTIVEGDVAEARSTPTGTVAIVDDARGCAHGPCLVRVTYGGDTRIKHGDVVRAYGRVTRAFVNPAADADAGSSTVPEIEADFVLLGHATR